MAYSIKELVRSEVLSPAGVHTTRVFLVTTFQRGWELFDLLHSEIHWQWWRDQQVALLGPPLPPFIHPAGLPQQPNGLHRRLDLYRVLEASGR